MVSTAVVSPGKFILLGVNLKGSWDLPLQSYSTGYAVSIFWSKKLLHRASFFWTSVVVGFHTVASEIIYYIHMDYYYSVASLAFLCNSILAAI